jgi:hypothetical protein
MRSSLNGSALSLNEFACCAAGFFNGATKGLWWGNHCSAEVRDMRLRGLL